MLQPWFDIDVVESQASQPIPDLPSRLRAVLGAPLGSPPLHELARKAVADAAPRPATAVIAVTDLTRACPDALLVPPMLDELNRGGIPNERITVVVAVGLHRPTTDDEKRQKLGDVVDRVRVGKSSAKLESVRIVFTEFNLQRVVIGRGGALVEGSGDRKPSLRHGHLGGD